MAKKYITILLAIFAITSGIYIDHVDARQLASKKPKNDLDDLRVSSHQIQDPRINYHRIEPRDDHQPSKTIVEQLTNHIGKPLVALTPKPEHKPNAAGAQSRKAKYYNAAGQSGGPVQSARVSGHKIQPSGVCQWMSLQEFKNVSLVTGELIIRDGEGEPRYILTLRGSIKKDDDSYFPLNKFQVHPEASLVTIGRSGSSGSSVKLPGNCSTNLKSGNLLLQQRPDRSFEEKITLLVECGYLVLQMQSNGMYLVLKSISFYRNLDAVSPVSLSGRKNRTLLRTIPLMQSEHLVFSNEGTQNYPLLKLPLTSRYTCLDRIVLTGKNSVQLELNRFELQRLANPMPREFIAHPNEDIADNQVKWITISQSDMRTKRSADGVVQRDSSSSIARCPRPTGPLTPLTSMMDPLFTRVNDDTLSEATSDKLTLMRASASRWTNFTVVNLNTSIATISYILTFYLVKYMVDGL